MGSCVRQEGWEIRLAEVIHSASSKRFKWGKHDCSLFSLDCLDAICKTDTASEWRGKYKNEEEAYALLDSRGGYETVYAEYGLELINPMYAKRGDIAYIGEEKAIGIVMGDHVVTTGLHQIEILPISCVVKVWSIPCHQ
jgi:hypothetical protein